MSKLAIVGSRNFNDEELFNKVLNAWIEDLGLPNVIISGGAPGADTLAKNFARKHCIPFQEFPAEWNTYGKRAGPLRNTEIVNACTHVLAFPSRQGRGTQDVIHKALAQNKDVRVHYVD